MLLNTLDAQDLYDCFTSSKKNIPNRVREHLNDPLVRAFDVPTSIDAVIDTQVPKAPARTKRSANIGQIGVDEFFMKSGGTLEVFEGGHLVPQKTVGPVAVSGRQG